MACLEEGYWRTKRQKVANWVKGRLHTTIVCPLMTYGMEVVPLTMKQEHLLKVAETRMLRISLGGTRRDNTRNKLVRKETNVGALHCKLRESQLRWKGQVARTEDGYVGKWFSNYMKERGREESQKKDCRTA